MRRSMKGVLALGLGAGAALLLDRRRRRWAAKGVHGARRLVVDACNRGKGLVATAAARFRREDVPDDVLVERVRSRLGHVTDHAGDVSVVASRGVVTLLGSVPAVEVSLLGETAASVRGVVGVTNLLQAAG